MPMIDAQLAQMIVESSTDFAIITFDQSGLITSWNIGAEALLGWSLEEAIGQHGRLIFTPEDQAAGTAEDEFARASVQGRALNERFHVRADGSRFWGSGLLMQLKGGEGFVKMVRDRTAERDAERRLVMRARHPDVPVVLTSGYSHVLAAEGTHGFHLLQKPYTGERLARAIKRARAGNRKG
ncbi:PAS domain S-box protein [Sphingobium sp. LMC3-1-1.1]